MLRCFDCETQTVRGGAGWGPVWVSVAFIGTPVCIRSRCGVFGVLPGSFFGGNVSGTLFSVVGYSLKSNRDYLALPSTLLRRISKFCPCLGGTTRTLPGSYIQSRRGAEVLKDRRRGTASALAAPDLWSGSYAEPNGTGARRPFARYGVSDASGVPPGATEAI